MGRDPREKPVVGDIVERDGDFRRVEYAHEAFGVGIIHAKVLSREPIAWTYSYTKDQWRREARTATIIHAEGE